jgi:hypothetical protein
MTEYPTVIEHFDLEGVDHDGNIQVLCPYHDENNPSASLNLQKAFLHCFTCGRGWHLSQVEEDLKGGDNPMDLYSPNTSSQEPTVSVEEPAIRTTSPEQDLPVPIIGFLMKRKLEVDNPGCRLGWDEDYLYFGPANQEGWPVGRRMQGDGPRYKNEPGKKNLFWLDAPTQPDRGVWLTEGVLDALAVRTVMPHARVAAALGADGLGDSGAYELRKHTIFLLYDRDYAGYRGARKAAEKLAEFGATPIILELPEHLGKDPGEALQEHEREFRQWVFERHAEFAQDDRAWVQRVFVDGDAPPLRQMSTGIRSWDKLLGGGFAEGVHAVGAETGAGKTSWAVAFAVAAVEAGHRVLYLTNEIPKRQVWARVASVKDEEEWNALEVNPPRAGERTREWLAEVATRLRVVAGWDVGRVRFAAPDYDAIVVDYLQRMPGLHGAGESAERLNIEHNITQLSNLGRDLGKVVVVITRLRNQERGAGMGIRDFYGSSAIRYVVQSGTVFRMIPGQQRINVDVGKNTRGATGVLTVQTDLGHQRFIDGGALVTGGVGTSVAEEKLA